MGTQAQKERRAKYAADLEQALRGAAGGDWNTDQELKDYLVSIGVQPDKALFNQLRKGGGYETYGPSWDPTRINDFVTGEEIMHQGPGEEWYDPNKPENWWKTNPLKSARMSGFFDWRDKNIGDENALATWYRKRGQSDRPNAPDMAWWNEGNKGMTVTPNVGMPVTPSAAPLTFTATSSGKQPPARQIIPKVPTSPYGISGSPTPITSTRSRRSNPAWFSTWRF